jgi:hypothetical protein
MVLPSDFYRWRPIVAAGIVNGAAAISFAIASRSRGDGCHVLRVPRIAQVANARVPRAATISAETTEDGSWFKRIPEGDLQGAKGATRKSRYRTIVSSG